MKHIDKAVEYALLTVNSPSFKDGELIPPRFTCDGENISPALTIENIPVEAKCLALIVDDPDAPRGTWVHWVVWNIPVTHQLSENSIHGIQGLNDFKKQQYGGPCPPSGCHRYYFKVYALSQLLEISANATKADLEKAMSAHIIGFGELMGYYSRNNETEK